MNDEYLQSNKQLPDFDRVEINAIEPLISNLLEDNRQKIHTLIAETTHPTWENFLMPLTDYQDRLHNAWSVVSHLNAVCHSPALRAAYQACLPLLTAYYNELGQNEILFKHYKTIADSAAFATFTATQKSTIRHALEDFQLSGIDLPEDKKQQYRELTEKLSLLTNRFSDNVLDCTNAWSHLITDEKALQGLPLPAIEAAKTRAAEKQQQGYLFTLDFPCYHAVVTYADDRQLRKIFYEAYVTRASDEGSHDKALDNSPVMTEILQLRIDLAQLLGFSRYTQYSLVKKMAKTETEVLDFLQKIARQVKDKARQEMENLKKFAQEKYQQNDLAAYDIAYFSEKYQQALFDFDSEALREYFPIEKVLQGLFTIVERLYGVCVVAEPKEHLWHKDAELFALVDKNKNKVAYFYLDLYARENKKGGAWMDDCRNRWCNQAQQWQLPVAYLTCNFMPPVGEKPGLLNHDEVLTLFHEFGHGLHHMLTTIDHPDVSGINGVPWDAVELPSQFFENWCWQAEGIALISAHYQTKAPLPNAILEKMLAAKNFQAAMHLARQIEFSLFDFRIHAELTRDKISIESIQQILNEIRADISPLMPPTYNRFQHGFTHIFAGGYAAGYYSYLWAEVLATDAFAAFREEGIFNEKTGRRFLENILQQGGSVDPLTLFTAFRGRPPEINALLENYGIS